MYFANVKCGVCGVQHLICAQHPKLDECGAACLAMAKYHILHVKQFADGLKMDASMDDLWNGAKKMGLTPAMATQAVVKTFGPETDNRVFLLLYRLTVKGKTKGHWVMALHGDDEHGVTICDPGYARIYTKKDISTYQGKTGTAIIAPHCLELGMENLSYPQQSQQQSQ